MIGYHILAMILGFLLDLIIGDPYWLPHPIRLIGNGISFCEEKLRSPVGKDQGDGERNADCGTESESKVKAEAELNELGRLERTQGLWLVICVLGMTALVSTLVLGCAYWLHPIAGVLIESIMTFQILATKCLKVESMKVYWELEKGDIPSARRAVSMIVGRDTECLDSAGIAKAAIETVAENTSDGVLAPMLYTAMGGPILGFLYKAVNTMDSMVGYKNEKYLNFGRAAAKLDDVVNYIPARISAIFLIGASFLSGKDYNGKQAWKIYRRDRYNHASPNSAQTESACAGALGIQLAGDASYFGKIVRKPYIGDAIRPVEIRDIKRVNRLMYVAAVLCECLCVLVLEGVYLWLR